MVNKGQYKKTGVAPQDRHSALQKLGDIRGTSLRSVIASRHLLSEDWGEGVGWQEEKCLLDLPSKLREA